MKFHLTIIFLLITTFLFAQQNLVTNPSFEDTISCPAHSGQIYLATGWSVLQDGSGSTPDLYNVCCTPSSGMSVPKNSGNIGFQYPHSGSGYSGIQVLVSGSGNENYREYMQSKLLDTLENGKTYCVKYYVNLSNYSAAYITTLGAYFDDGSVSAIIPDGLAAVTPQIYNVSQPLMDTLNWMQIEGSFIATGNEEYITIGNFFPDSLSGIGLFGSPTAWASYYLIDDVSVTLCDSTDGFNENIISNQKAQIFPNPATNELTIDFVITDKCLFELYDLIGAKRMSVTFDNSSLTKRIDLTNIDSGLYFYSVVDRNGNKIKTGKLIIIK